MSEEKLGPNEVSIRSSPEGEEKRYQITLYRSGKTFQSAPHPKVRRNTIPGALFLPTEVSIRSSPEGEEKLGNASPSYHPMPRFQSAPHPKVRRNIPGESSIDAYSPYVSIRSSPEGEEKLGLSQMTTDSKFVSIRSSPEGEEKQGIEPGNHLPQRFQSAPHPKVRRNDKIGMGGVTPICFNPLLTRR